MVWAREFFSPDISFSGAQQSRAGPLWRAKVDCRDHGGLGRHFRFDDFCRQPTRLLLAALSAGRRRSRIFPRHDPLFAALVSLRGAGTGHRVVYDGGAPGWGHRRSDLRPAVGSAARSSHGMAMAISDRGSAGNTAGRGGARISYRPAGNRDLALGGTAQLAGGTTGARGEAAAAGLEPVSFPHLPRPECGCWWWCIWA